MTASPFQFKFNNKLWKFKAEPKIQTGFYICTGESRRQAKASFHLSSKDPVSDSTRKEKGRQGEKNQ